MIKVLIKSICLLLFLITVSSPAWAQTFGPQVGGGGGSAPPTFTPSLTDSSVNYLGQIFGTVGTVLHGTSGQMLGQIFKIFNIGLLVLAGVFLVYTIVMTVLSTAHEGEFMGRKWNSAWIAIRTVFGLGLLVPSATTGYSTIQVIVMWVVLQGVGFANMAWGSALDYMMEGGTIYTPPPVNTASMVDLVGNVLEMQVCMYFAQNAEQTAQKNLKQAQQQNQGSGANTNTAAPTAAVNNVANFTPLFVTYFDSEQKQYNSVVKFPGNAYSADGEQDNACGQISFGSNADKNALQQDTKAATLQAAVRQIMLDVDTYAKQFGNGTTNSQNLASQVQSGIVGGAADWVNITLPIRTLRTGAFQDALTGYVEYAKMYGWVLAGAYYQALGSIQSQITAATSVSVNIDKAPAGMITPAKGAYISFNEIPSVSTDRMSSLLGLSSADRATLAGIMGNQGAGINVQGARNLAGQVDQAGQLQLEAGGMGGEGSMSIPGMSQVNDFLQTVAQTMSTSVGDPILLLRTIGLQFMGAASLVWVAITLGFFGLGLASSFMSSISPLGFALTDMLEAFILPFIAFVLLFYTLGATFAFYVPLIPLIIFIFSSIGWFISVIEAMVAAPLVAFGITHPEGHDLLGKSEQAIMLLLSVFLRPVLMIIGLFAGMILSRIALQLLNTAFFSFVFTIVGMDAFAFLLSLVVYCMLIITVVNQAFSLIHVVPDRIMRWIGLSGEQTTAPQEALQSAKGGFEQVSGGIQKMQESAAANAIKKLQERKKPPGEEETTGTGKT